VKVANALHLIALPWDLRRRRRAPQSASKEINALSENSGA
jgi:hypothetical protein